MVKCLQLGRYKLQSRCAGAADLSTAPVLHLFSVGGVWLVQDLAGGVSQACWLATGR